MSQTTSHVVYFKDSTTVMYHYYPSLAAALVFVGVFGLSAILHTYQLIRTRALYMIPMLLGVVFEVVGYIGRSISSSEVPNCSLGPYIIQAILILIAPALFAASVYMMLGYIIQAVDAERHSPIRKKFLTKIFVLGDILSFLVQSNGAGLLTQKKKNAPTVGKWIIVGGLAIQLIFFGYFMIVTITFSRRLSKDSTCRPRCKNVPWRQHIFVLFAASILIFVRSIFRVIEYVQGTNGYLLSHEIWLYIFDATLMSIVVLLFNIIHPSQITGLITGRGAMRLVLSFLQTESFSSLRDEEEMAETDGMTTTR